MPTKPKRRAPPSGAKTAGPKAAPSPRPDAPRRAPAKPKFRVGEMVVYPFHGVGTIRALENRAVLDGQKRRYYVIEFREGELTVMVPVEKQDEVGMRRTISPREVPKVLSLLGKRVGTEEADWKVRHSLYLDKLKSGSIYAAAEVARNLSKRGPEGELSMSEKRLLESSFTLLVHEIATVRRQPPEKVKEEIEKILKKSKG